MVAVATRCLERHRVEVDQLNVFPVPDGDTGTNLLLTLRSAQAELDKVASSSLAEVSGALARGSLLGARGNSGVILSQIFRGLARTFEGKREADGFEVGMALQEGVQAAYRAVVRPVEGTILTVAREAARRAVEVGRRGRDVVTVLREAWKGARESLSRTPDLLPVLKKAGVVDAGGQGFVYILEGLVTALVGEEGSAQLTDYLVGEDLGEGGSALPAEVVASPEAGEFPYDLVALWRGPVAEERLREELAGWCDSLVVAQDGELVKVHLHTPEPDRALGILLRYGSLLEARVEDMRRSALEPIPLQVVAVAPGPGWRALLENLGAVVVDGGPTMNPSASELLAALERARAREVILLPGHPNALAVSHQVAALSRVPVEVIPAVSAPQALAALLAFNAEFSREENRQAMEAARQGVKTGLVTRAVRDGIVGELAVREGDVLGFLEEEAVAAAPAPEEAILQLLERAKAEEAGAITLFYGAGVPEEAASSLAERVRQRYPGALVEVHAGGQPLHEYIVSLE